MSLLDSLFGRAPKTIKRPDDGLVDSRAVSEDVYLTTVFVACGVGESKLEIQTLHQLSEAELAQIKSGTFDIPGEGPFTRVIGNNLRVRLIFPNHGQGKWHLDKNE